MSSHLMKNPNTQKSTRQGSTHVRRIVTDEKDGISDSVQEIMEITGESEEVVRGAFLDVGNNKNEEIINYILDNKGKLSEEWKTAGSKRNKAPKNEVKVHKEEYNNKRGNGRKNDKRGRGDRRSKGKEDQEFSEQRYNNYSKDNNYRQKNEQRYYRQDNRTDRGYDRPVDRSDRYNRRGGRRGGSGRGGGRAGYRNVNNRSYNNRSRNDEPKQESGNSWSEMMQSPDWDNFRNEDEIKPVQVNGHDDSVEEDWGMEAYQESLKETKEFKSTNNDQVLPVEVSEDVVKSPQAEKKVQQGTKIDINTLFGTSVNASEASKNVTATINEAEDDEIVDTTTRLSQTEIADNHSSVEIQNDEPTPVVEAAEPCDNSADQEVVASECPENDVETKSNIVPVPSVKSNSPVASTKSEESDATKRIKAQLGIPTKSSNVMKFGFNDKNLPEIKQEIRKGPCKTTNHVVPCNSNELMQSPSDGVSMPKGAQHTEDSKVFSFGDFTASPKAEEPDILSGAEQFMLSPGKEDGLSEIPLKHKSPVAVDLNKIFSTVDTHQVVASPSAGVSNINNVSTPTKFEQVPSQQSTPARYNEVSEQQNMSAADTSLRVPPGLAQQGIPSQSQPTLSKPQQFANFPPQGSMGNIVHSNENTNQQANSSVTNGSYYPSNDQLTSQVDSPSAAANSIRSPAAGTVKQQNKNINELIQQPNQQTQGLGGLINSNMTSQLSQQHSYISQPQIPLSGGYQQHHMYNSQQQMQQKPATNMYQQPATTSNIMPVISTAPQHTNLIKSSIPTNQMLANNKATNQVLHNNFNMVNQFAATPLIPSQHYAGYYDPLYNNQLGSQQRSDIQTQQQQNSSQQQQAPNHAKFNRGEPASPVLNQNIMNTLIGASSSNQQQQAGQSNHNQAPKVTQQQPTGGQPAGLTPAGHHQHFVHQPMPYNPYNAHQLYYHNYGPFFPQQISQTHAQNAKHSQQVQQQYNSYSAQQQATNTTTNDIQNKPAGFPANHMISAGGGNSTAASGGGSQQQTVQPMHQSYFPHQLGFAPNVQLMQHDVNQAVGSQRTQQNTSQLSGKNPGGNVKPPFGNNAQYWSQ